jgi:hypothetical protein
VSRDFSQSRHDRFIIIRAALPTALVAPPSESRYIRAMHFSRHLSLLHSTFSLLAALKLRGAR